MNDNDEIAVTMWRALEKADTPEAGGIVLAKLVATWLGGYRPLDRAARWSEFQHTMRREMAARDRRRACRAGRAHRRREGRPAGDLVEPASWRLPAEIQGRIGEELP